MLFQITCELRAAHGRGLPAGVALSLDLHAGSQVATLSSV